MRACVCVCVRVRARARARVCVCVCVVSVIVKRPVLPPSVVDGRSRNPLYYYDVYIFLCGDLNSRTSNEFPISQSGNDVFTRPVEETPTRCSEDTVLNSFGKKVIEYVYHFWIEYFEWSL